MRDERFKVVSVLDPAIDTERMPTAAMHEYMTTRDVRKLQPYFKPGVKPTEFHVREVPHELWETFVMGGQNEAERYRRAFMCGVERIDELHQNDGSTISSWTPPLDGVGVMKPDAVVRVSPQEREEIGAVVWYHSFLARRIDGCFRVPPSSLELLGERLFLRVVASPSLPALSSDAASSPLASAPPVSTPTGPTSESNGGSCAPPMAVTATGSAFQVAS